MDQKENFEIGDYQRGARQTSVFVPNDLWVLAKQNLIEFKSAMIFGIQFKIAEKQGFDFPDNSLLQKITRMQKVISDQAEELERLRNPSLKDKVNSIFDQALQDPEKVKQEADELMKSLTGEKDDRE